MKIELLRELMVADHVFIGEKPHVDPRLTTFIIEGGGFLQFRDGRMAGFSLDTHQRKLNDVFFALVDRIKERGWHWEVSSVPNIRDEQYKATLQRRGHHREKWDRHSCHGSTPLEALVKAYISMCKAVAA